MFFLFRSTREIKPNQTDIGRKVKVKQIAGRAVPPIRKDAPLRDNPPKPSFAPTIPSSKPVVHSSNGLSNGLGNNHVNNNSRPQQQNKPSIPDIVRRPIK